MSTGTALPESAAVASAGPRRPHSSGLTERWPELGAASVCLVAAAVRFYGIGRQGFWYDEANTAQLVHFSLGKMLGLIPQTESTPPLYYCLAWFWARVFGYGEVGLRSLSAVAGVLTVPAAYGAAARLVSRRTGLIVAALCACNPLLIWYAQEARSYAVLVLFSALAMLAFARVLEEPTRRNVLAWVVCCALALATHYYAAVVVAPQAAWLLLEHRNRRAVQLGVAGVMACGLALVPLALSQNSTGRDSWIAHSPFGLRLAQIVPQFLIGTDAPARLALKFAAMALGAGALIFLACARRAPERSRALGAGGLALAGLALSLAFAGAGSDALITRNLLGLWLPAATAVAGGLVLARPRWVGAAGAGALCAIGLTAALSIPVTYDFQRPDWRGVARVLGPGPAPGSTRVILIQHYRTLLPLSLYLPRLGFVGQRGASRVRELDVIAMSSPQQPLCWWGAACNLIPSRAQASYEIPGFHELWRRRIHRFTIVRLAAAGSGVSVAAAQVAGALTATTLPRDDLLVQR